MGEIAAKNKRIYYIDSGRALASILGIFYHSALVFSSPWIVNIDKPDFSSVIFVFQTFSSTFRMPLFLFIAGYFTYSALWKYDSAGFLIHRARRILLPFVASLVILIPFQLSFLLLVRYGESWRDYYLAYLNPLGAQFAMQHLWFLYDLAVYAPVVCGFEFLRKRFCLPVMFKSFVTFMHRRFITALVFWVNLNVVMTMITGLLQYRLNITSAWLPIGELGHNLPMFLFGCYCYTNKEVMNKLIHPLSHRIIWTVVVVAILFPLRTYLSSQEVAHSSSILTMMDIPLRWIMTLGVLSLLKLFLNRMNPVLRYLSEASYPVYLFHHPIIVAVAYVYVSYSLPMPAIAGYAIVSVMSLILTYLSFEIIIRRSQIGALLFTGVSFPGRLRPEGRLVRVRSGHAEVEIQ